ncbi:hypothetical protein [Kitasatospora sp. SUK 42]|uniref:hypothetical protein n=1 Tax=Kitasatospora sp. SUK 42 TaxID=1588882 RepID=UPI0018C961E1|nr:hypothetical protein [Kitasatospora sp. SUK 42]MBV2154797.1 hypothetical protein [Kitasatospora sp. SUK 42]
MTHRSAHARLDGDSTTGTVIHFDPRDGETAAQPAGRAGRRRPAAAFFAVSAVVVAGWAVLLGLYADPGVRLMWIGFDVLEASVMALAARLAARSDPRASLAAAGLAVFMLTDLWIDVATATPDYLPTAVLMALTVELPYALGCVVYALRVFGRARA